MCLVCAAALRLAAIEPVRALPGVAEVVASKLDLWGEAALREPGGPSYEFFEKLLPPLRYVDAGFLHYPILLSAPGAAAKTRFVSNGSAFNALGRTPVWVNEIGVPIEVRVGDARETFGADSARLDGPRYVDGFLPIVQVGYAHGSERYGEECFASVDEKLAATGATCVRFDFAATDGGRIELRFDAGTTLIPGAGGKVRDAAGKVLATYDDNWAWIPSRNMLLSKERHAASGYVLIFTQPVDAADAPVASAERYRHERELAVARWNSLLASGMQVEVPEARVNHAWRALVIGNFAILAGEQMNYSAGNQYQRKYANESGEAARAFLLWGHPAITARTIPPLFTYTRKNIELHDGAFKLMNLAGYFAITRDAAFVRETRKLWQAEIDLLLRSRVPHTGLLQPEKYCSDIATPVVSVSTNASAWRGLRDMANVLADLGEPEEARRLAAAAAEYRQATLRFIERSWIRTAEPPFLPLAPSIEQPPDPITGTSLGSYWNLVINQFLNAAILPADSREVSDVLRYIQTKGGLCMGMTRFQSPRGTWVNVQNIDDLYGLRYMLTLLERDEVDRALVSFYGKLAQGFTRDTFIDGEVTSIFPVDAHGRQLSLPPNSAANASFLLQLRHLLVQDADTDLDGRADTLRLAFGTPRAWLSDGKKISVARAPTAFGTLSFTIESKLGDAPWRRA